MGRFPRLRPGQPRGLRPANTDINQYARPKQTKATLIRCLASLVDGGPTSNERCVFVRPCVRPSWLFQAGGGGIKADTVPRHRPNVELMLSQRRKRWPNIVLTLGQCLVFAGQWIIDS